MRKTRRSRSAVTSSATRSKPDASWAALNIINETAKVEHYVYHCDAPAQLYDKGMVERFRRAEADVETAAKQIMGGSGDLAFLRWGSLTVERVRHWLAGGVGDIRKSAFGTTLWGRIRWDRTLGRPSTNRLYEAFSFDHWYLWIEVSGTEGEPIVKEAWIKQPEPRVWDGPHDDQSYRVSFMIRAVPTLLNRFWPAMRPDVQWNPQFPSWSSTRRALVWPESMLPFGNFSVGRDDVLVLEEYRVIKRF
jgi:hypothetical protein